MITPGRKHLLKIVRFTDQGAILGDGESEVLMPKRLISQHYSTGTELEVFVFADKEGINIATTKMAFCQIGEFASLRIKSFHQGGVFLDWGIDKDIFLPAKEVPDSAKIGDFVLIYLTIDEQNGKIIASSRIHSYTWPPDNRITENMEVDLIIAGHTRLGYKVIINNTYEGVLYENEVFEPLKTGDKVKGFIKKIREDEKIDVALQFQGYAEVENATEKILDVLNKNFGFIHLNDHSAPEKIYETLHMSKKTFKKAVGAMYKARKIRIENDGIRLIED